MQLAICITTRNRPQELTACLAAIWAGQITPSHVVVSDDSPDPLVQQQNQAIIAQYPQTRYLLGPRRGVCANRNRAVNAVGDADLIAFVDDDICVQPDFVALALQRYGQIAEAEWTILTGISRDPQGHVLGPTRLSFRGYFQPCPIPEAVVIHAALFPRRLFEQEQWDEDIFFGYEDAELCLRALKLGYRIVHMPELQVHNRGYEQGTLIIPSVGHLTDYEIYIEAARLYVGIKRYRQLFPNGWKLAAFIGLYFSHMTLHLLRRRSLQALPEIVRRSRIERLWRLRAGSVG